MAEAVEAAEAAEVAEAVEAAERNQGLLLGFGPQEWLRLERAKPAAGETSPQSLPAQSSEAHPVATVEWAKPPLAELRRAAAAAEQDRHPLLRCRTHVHSSSSQLRGWRLQRGWRSSLRAGWVAGCHRPSPRRRVPVGSRQPVGSRRQVGRQHVQWPLSLPQRPQRPQQSGSRWW